MTLTEQDTHKKSEANYNNQHVGMRLDAKMQMQEGSTPVKYRLAAVVFRTGEQHNGHYFNAVPDFAANWVVFNTESSHCPTQPCWLQSLAQQ